ncbi:DUF1616 domain-containing protein [Halalkalicoccus jeotgali]|uniref:DUF1616 domain-containing protein n=1 Tax=Halalkalicoccus jeotgali (strain DSM 18796 / CECT 7217 / JCM 14584 / KCTC 4019 / B3) TaxID=795797 RepID=D8J758_HALJB|nr:DUF1616 domain-containing protein [Halalkalicoccus jeotgali]ADJ13953.1 hypothetical protein HacjB3_02800 [Halalkalicoccus jeotgali B3]ELY34004.1 hypothetical protein C497_16522 [Halalkalicoccus jeotgali B3]
MSSERDWWLLLPPAVRRFPADLVSVLIFTLLTVLAVFLPGVRETPLRIVVGLPFVLFIPGYVFVAALFPEHGESVANTEEEVSTAGDIDPIERIALAFGLSIAIVPLLGLILNFTPWGIQLAPIMLTVSGATIVCTIIAAVRRWELPPEERFSVPYREWVVAGRTELFDPTDRIDAALTVALALSIMLAVGSVGFAIASPQQGEQFSEFYLLTENEEGELVASDYPQEFVQGESQPLTLGIENNEYESVDYTVVVQLQRVEGEGNQSTVVERDELDQVGTTLEHNETWQEEYPVTPTMRGEDLRLTFLLYDGEVPAEPTRENAYRETHLWVNVA